MDDQERFGDFQVESKRIQPRSIKFTSKFERKFRISKLSSRKIDQNPRLRDSLQVGTPSTCGLPAGFHSHAAASRNDHSGLFREWNELGW